jgi:hypothetical protein
MPFPRRLLPIILALGVCGTLAPRAAPARAAKTFTFDLPLADLEAAQDSILSDLTGAVEPGMLGRVHSLAADEDLHFALNVPGLETPVVCELMNASSVPAKPPGDEEWHARWEPLFERRARIIARGVLRLWPDHPAVGREASEGSASSNPAHVLELHPLAALVHDRVTDDLRANIAPITLNGKQYRYKDARQWAALLRNEIDAARTRKNG